MKRIVSFLVSVMLIMTTAVFANAQIPKELTTSPENFTAAYKMSLVMDDNSDIRNLIDEILSTDEFLYSTLSTNVISFITAIFDSDSDVNLQLDMSSDYKKIQMSLTSKSTLSSTVSSNLNYTVNANAGAWLDMDFSDESNPKLDVIFLVPASDKYYRINAGRYITQEQINSFKEFFGKEEFRNLYDEIQNVIYGSLDLKKTRSGYKFSMNNEEFTKYADEVLSCLMDAQLEGYSQLPFSFEDISILGGDGIEAEYTIKNGFVSYALVSADISIDISSIVKAMGEEWPYKASGKINMKLTEKVDFTKIGKTKVEYPVVSDENSVLLNSMIDEQMTADYYEDYTFEYPYWSAYAYLETLPVINGEFYVPVRAILEDGYAESVSIDYINGVITAASEYFDGFKTLTVTVGSDKVYTDATEHTISEALSVNGVTYVNARLFTDVFGWELSSVNHDLLADTYEVWFNTQKQDEYY